MKAFLVLACVIGLSVAAPMLPYPQLPIYGLPGFPNVISAEIVLPQIFPQLPLLQPLGHHSLELVYQVPMAPEKKKAEDDD